MNHFRWRDVSVIGYKGVDVVVVMNAKGNRKMTCWLYFLLSSCRFRYFFLFVDPLSYRSAVFPCRESGPCRRDGAIEMVIESDSNK